MAQADAARLTTFEFAAISQFQPYKENAMYALNQMLSKMKRQILSGMLLLMMTALLSSVSFAHNVSAGCDDAPSGAVTINDSDNWVPLCSIKNLDLTDGTHTCIATGSAYVENKNMTADQHNEYRFAIARSKNPSTDGPGELQIDVVQNENVAALDLKHQPVTVVQHFDNVTAGKRNFYWLGRKVTTSPVTDNINAEHFAMGIVCTDGK